MIVNLQFSAYVLKYPSDMTSPMALTTEISAAWQRRLFRCWVEFDFKHQFGVWGEHGFHVGSGLHVESGFQVQKLGMRTR